MTPQEFSQKIKSKYPQYKDRDDVELARAMVDKYPQYASKVNFEEKKEERPKIGTMEGFIDPFKQTGIGIAKGIGRIGLGIGSLGRGVQQFLQPKGIAGGNPLNMGGESVFDQQGQKRAQAEEALKGDTRGQKIGSFLTEVGAMAIPSAGAVKATKGLGFARAMLGRGLVGATTGTIQGGGDIDKDTAIGAGAEILFPVIGKLVKIGGGVLRGTGAVASGTSSDVIEQVVKNPKQALQGASDDSLKATASIVRQGTKELKKKAGQEFAEATKDFTQQMDKDDIVTKALKYIDDMEAESFKVDSGDMDKLRAVIKNWDDFSPKGVNGMASKISDFYSGSVNAVPEDRIVAGLNRTIRDWVGEQVPEIAEANAKYADKMDLLAQMDAIFKTKGAIDSRLGMQKTAQAVSRLFNANKDMAREGVEELQKELGIDILGREAGRQLGSGTFTRFQTQEGLTGVARALIPQQTILRLSAGIGVAKEAIESRLNVLEPTARATVIEVLTDLLGEGEGQDLPQTTKTETLTEPQNQKQ